MITERRTFIGGSDARIIMGNDETRLVRLWQEKRGEVVPDDLGQDLLVQLGTITEELNRTWYERCSGNAVQDVQRRVRHPIHKWMGATLDGRVQQTGAVYPCENRGSVDHHRWRKMGRDQGQCRPALPASTAYS